MEKINLLVVFIEGLLSFLSPCVLPILPIYLSMLSNSNVNDLKNSKFDIIKSSLLKNTLFFTLGISTTFFILGSSANIITSIFSYNKDVISFVGGIIVMIMGLFYVDIIKSSTLNKEKRFNYSAKKMNIFTSYILGFTFSFGWTPCIGPILASVLIMASSSSSALTSNLLIGVYTLGFILPFLIVAMFYNKLVNSIDKLKSNIENIKKIGGIILIISGMIMTINGFDGVRAYFYGKDKAPIKSEEKTEDDTEDIDDTKIKSIDFELVDQYGKKHKLSEYKGKTVFLNFWATWCPPCRSEMPHIEDIYKEYGKNNDDVIILGMAAPNLGKEGSKEHIIDFLEENDYTFPVLFDETSEIFYQYGINSFPSTFIINEEGYVTQYVPGALDKDTMKYLIENGN
ncbi:MAG: cytochrome c biogenesis protein CcdA [Peptostreptococcaceae bacterium]